MTKRRAFLAASLALLVLAGWLMSRGDRPIKAPRAKVEFKHFPSQKEQTRNQRRRTLAPAPAPSAEEGYRQKRDPLMTALPPKSKSTVVFEANALKKSPAVRYLLDCLTSPRDMERLAQVKDELGFDPLEDIDRFAISSDSAGVLSGDFSGVRWDAMAGRGAAYGVHGMVYGGGESPSMAVWNKQILLFGGDEAVLHAAIDRLEDRGPPAEPPIPDSAAYGDIYGFLAADDVAHMLPASEQDLAARFQSALSRVELHVDASDEVALTADATGPSPDDVTDLGKSLGAALSLGRISAQAQGDDKLAELLELASVSPRDGGRFSFDLALPLDVVKRQMGPCPRDAGRGDGG